MAIAEQFHKTPRRPRQTEAQWRELICEYDTSGMSIQAFCQSRNLSKSSFYLWRNKFGAIAKPRFTPLVAPAAADSSWEIELLLDEGIVLKLRRH